MLWLISGDRNGVVLGVSDTGMPICHGRGSHEPKPPELDHALLGRIRAAPCGWRLTASSDCELHKDGDGDGLFKRVQGSPAGAHGMVRFHEQPADRVAFVMVVPDATLAHICRVL